MNAHAIDWARALRNWEAGKFPTQREQAAALGCNVSTMRHHFTRLRKDARREKPATIIKPPAKRKPGPKRKPAKPGEAGIPLENLAAAAFGGEKGREALGVYMAVRHEWQNVGLFLAAANDMPTASKPFTEHITTQLLAEFLKARGLSRDALEFAAWFPKRVGLPLPPEWTQ